MGELVSERIEVERDARLPRPVSFTWRGETHVVAEILEEWVDTGYGHVPPRSRKWFTRRHRRYFVVRTSAGDTFEMYFDYADKRHHTWWLVARR